MGGSKAQTSTTQTQQTNQVDNRIGASDQAIVATGGSTVYGAGASNSTIGITGNVHVESIDAETVAGALGVADTVVRELALMAGQTAETALVENSNVANTAIREVADIAATSAGVAETAVRENSDVAQSGLDLAATVVMEQANTAAAMADLATDSIREQTEVTGMAFDFGAELARGAGDIAAAGIDTANNALDVVADANREAALLADRSNAMLAGAFETFGTELSKVKAIEVSEGQTERNKVTIAVIIGAVILGLGAIIAFFKRRK